MTIIVGYKHKNKVYMGGDAFGVAGLSLHHRIDPKVFVTHKIAYGFTSSYRMGQILRFHSEEIKHDSREQDPYHYVVVHLIPMWRDILSSHGYTTITNNKEQSGNFLVGFKGHLFNINTDFQVGIPKLEYDAVGCGTEFALGCLYQLNSRRGTQGWSPKRKIEEAIKTASYFSAGCGGGSTIVQA